MEPTAQPVDQPTTKNFQQQEKTKKPFFVSKLFFIIIIGLTFFVLVTIGYFLLVKRELKTTISPSDLPLGNPITTKSKSDKFEIPTATQSGKKVLLKYNGGDEELLYAISLSLDKKWLTYYLLGEKTEIINLQNKAQHKIPFKKGGYWEKIVWASDNKSFYAAVKVGLPIPSEAFCQLYLVSLDDLEGFNFNYDEEFVFSPIAGDIALSPDNQKLAFIDPGKKSLEVLLIADGEINTYDEGNVRANSIKGVLSWSPDSQKIIYPSEDSIRMLDLKSGNIIILIPDLGPRSDSSWVLSGSSPWLPKGDKVAIYYETIIKNDTQWDINYWLNIFSSDGNKIAERRIDINNNYGFYRLLWADEKVYFCPRDVLYLSVSYPENNIIYQNGNLIIQDSISEFVEEFCQIL